MSETITDGLIVNIDNMLNNLSSTPSKPSMFRVGDNLRSINQEAYDPQIIAIGPFHHSKPNLQKMEHHKVRYLKLFLQRRKESSVERCVNTISHLEDRARECYAEDIQLDKDKFVQMLILDGCFIIEFLYMFQHGKYSDEDDPIFQYSHIRNQLLDDLMILENQIPFFIIDHLFKTIKINSEDNVNSLIWPLLQTGIFPVQVQDLPEVPNDAHHLLGILHHNLWSSSEMDFGNSDKIVGINSAIELEEAGISFKKSEDNSFFGIKFENKALIIQEWKIFDTTESVFRNLIAYENYLIGTSQKYVTDYVFFMHCLIRSPKDANLLRRNGIISNFLGSDEMVYNLFNQLDKYVTVSSQFSYFNIFKRVNEHCSHKRNRWMATLRRKYFNSPWALNSVFAAIVLLVLSIMQATFAILSYRHDLKNGK